MAGATARMPLCGAGALLLTTFRLAVAVALLPLGWGQPRLPAWVVILAGWAALTDALDGRLARRASATSRQGAFLDLWADKLWVLAVLVLLVRQGVLGPLVSALILLREAAVSLRRRGLDRRGLDLPPTPRSKAKTALQMAGLWLLLAEPHLPGRGLLIWGIAVYTWGSGIELLCKQPIQREKPHARA